jgi:site-specific recombinase XerD
VKAHAEAVGLDPTVFSGHSLRAGFVTSALQSTADVLRVMDVTRHRQINTLKVYDRRANRATFRAEHLQSFCWIA